MAYFADVVPGQSASVVACFNLCRNVAAALSAAVSLINFTLTLGLICCSSSS
jgi:hypothetical protein